MPITYKIDVLAALKAAGYSTYKLRKEKILAESTLQQFRNSDIVSNENLSRVCELLRCQPGDILEYVPEEAPPVPDETPNTETLEAFAELDNGGGHSFSGTTEQLFSELMEDEDA